MVPDALSTLGLPPIDQIGFVVPDIDAAIARYEPMFGPFSRMEAPLDAVDYRGRPEDCRLRLAFGRSGSLEIELIQWVSGHSPHREFIERGRPGMHHVRFCVDDADAWVARARGLGYETIWYKRYRPDTIWAYMERSNDPLLIEFFQQPRSAPGV